VTDPRGAGQLDHGAAWSVLFLVELGLVRLEHADFAPSVEEQRDGRHPQDHHADDDERLLGAYDDRA